MNWEQIKATNNYAAQMAESGDIYSAIKAYIRGGCFRYSPKQLRKLRKSQFNSAPGKTRLSRNAVDARIFYTAYRRFFLNKNIEKPLAGG